MKLFYLRPRLGLLVQRTMCSKPPVTASSEVSQASDNMSARYRPTEFQKFILVWTKKYKTKEEIPKFVSADLIDRSRSQARIKVSNILMILTAMGSIGAILAGKAAAKRGESIQTINQSFHQQYRDEYEKKHAQDSK